MATLAINKLQDSATGRALESVIQGSAVLTTFEEFTSDLIRNVFNTLVDTSMDQLEAYAELVSKVSGTLADYQARALGDDNTINTKVVPDYITNVVRAQFENGGPTVTYPLDIDPAKLEDFKALFDGVTANISGTDYAIDDTTLPVIVAGPPITITQANLEAFVKAKLKKEVKKSYDLIVTILKLGMQKIVVTDGEIHTKLTFHVDAKDTDESTAAQSQMDTYDKSVSWGVDASFSGNRAQKGRLAGRILSKSLGGSISGGVKSSKTQSQVKVNVANEKHTAQTTLAIDILGEVTVRFRSDFFPSFDPASVAPGG